MENEHQVECDDVLHVHEEAEEDKWSIIPRPLSKFYITKHDNADKVFLTGMAFDRSSEHLILLLKINSVKDKLTLLVNEMRIGKKQNLVLHKSAKYNIFDHGALGISDSKSGEVLCAGYHNNNSITSSVHGVFRLQWNNVPPITCQYTTTPGFGDNEFNRPSGCCHHPSGQVFVSDRDNNRVYRMIYPCLAPVGHFGDGLLTYPTHLATFIDPFYDKNQLLVCHNKGISVFNVNTLDSNGMPTFHETFANGTNKNWGGLCVHWGLIFATNTTDNAVYVFRVDSHTCQFKIEFTFKLKPLGMCLPRYICTHLYKDLVYINCIDSSNGESAILILQLEWLDPNSDNDQQEENNNAVQ